MALERGERAAFAATARQLRLDIIDTMVWAGGAHVGGAMSLADILVLLYWKYLRIDPARPGWEERDRLVVSKGHAGAGIAPALALRGYFPKAELETFNHFRSPFGMHLDAAKVRGVDCSTGSLGHGLSLSVGLALGARLQGRPWKTWCVLGDGECDEGSVWEAAMAASHFKLDNLVVIVDRNGLMIDGRTEEIMSLEPFEDKWKAFGFLTRAVDGHDFDALAAAFDYALSKPGRPVVIVANTVKGKGVDFMEGDVRWHYGSADSSLAAKARASIELRYAATAGGAASAVTAGRD